MGQLDLREGLTRMQMGSAATILNASLQALSKRISLSFEICDATLRVETLPFQSAYSLALFFFRDGVLTEQDQTFGSSCCLFHLQKSPRLAVYSSDLSCVHCDPLIFRDYVS